MRCDIHRFKQVNDTVGHGTGDVALSQAAPRLGRILSGADAVGCIGGDGFLVIRPDADMGFREAVAERLRQAVSTPSP